MYQFSKRLWRDEGIKLFNGKVCILMAFFLFAGQMLFGEARTVSVGSISMEATHSFKTPLLQKIKNVTPLIAEGARQGLDIIVLPEYYFRGRHINSDAQDLNHSVVLDSMKASAKRNHIYVAFQVVEKDGGNLYNTVSLVDRNGEFVGKYRKVNLPPEEHALTPGDAYHVFDTDFGRIGFLICWDFWFTNPAKALVDMGAEMIIVPTWCNIERNLQTNAAEEGVPIVFSVLRIDCSADDENLPSSVFDHHGDPVYTDVYVGANKIAIGKVTLGDYKNLALHKPVTTSTGTDPQHPGLNAVDGKYSTERDASAAKQTYWRASSLPQWIEIDLGDDFAVDRVSIAQFNTESYEYKLEGRASEGEYEVISEQFDRKETFLEHGVAGSEILTSRFDAACCTLPKKYRYVKLTINSSVESEAAVNEVKVFGRVNSRTKVGMDNISVPKQYQILKNYPNPFNQSTTIQFEVPRQSHVMLDIANMNGQKVVSLANACFNAGLYNLKWNGKDQNNRPLSSSLYFCCLTTDGQVLTRKMLLLK